MVKSGESYSKILYVLKASEVSALAKDETGTIKIGAGHNGRLREIRATVLGTLETVVCSGGLVEILNDAFDMVCTFVVGGMVAVTEGGGADQKELVIPCDFPLIGGSTFTVNYTPQDDQGQALEIELGYVVGAEPDLTRPNYIKADLEVFANAISQITVDEKHNTVDIPLTKGGETRFIDFTVFPTGETVVCAGGKVVLDSENDDWKPCEFIIPSVTTVGASGGGQIWNHRRTLKKTMTGGTSIYNDYTPYDNQAQIMGITIAWRGRKIALS